MDSPFVFRVVELGGPGTAPEDIREMASRVVSVARESGAGRIIVGSTYADLDPDGPQGITLDGLEARWDRTYEPQGFTRMLVLALPGEEDIVGCLACYEMMPVELARLIERRLDESIPDELDATREEIAGGGRLGKTRRKVGVVYAALGPA